jgi:hypothetical protein
MKKLRRNQTQRNAGYSVVQYLFGFPFAIQKIQRLKYTQIKFCLFLCGCKTWSLIIRAGHRLRVFHNRVLRRIFGPKRDEVKGERRKLHNEELNDLYCSSNIIRVIK